MYTMKTHSFCPISIVNCGTEKPITLQLYYNLRNSVVKKTYINDYTGTKLQSNSHDMNISLVSHYYLELIGLGASVTLGFELLQCKAQ
jgi:hypothetical protein